LRRSRNGRFAGPKIVDTGCAQIPSQNRSALGIVDVISVVHRFRASRSCKCRRRTGGGDAAPCRSSAFRGRARRDCAARAAREAEASCL